MDKTKNKTLTEDLKLYFMVKNVDSSSMSLEMQTAFETGREYFVHENGIQMMSEAKCLKFDKLKLTKQHIFIMELFEGEAFEYIKNSPAFKYMKTDYRLNQLHLAWTRAYYFEILGPKCFISCFIDDTPIPLGSSPVFTAAMKNIVVSASGVSPDKKTEIEKLVQWMGGHYMQHTSMACTHLVSNTVKSTKYEKSAETKKIKIMHPDWIDDVWQQCQVRNIHANDDIFKKHSLPIFFKLVVTSTGLKPDVKQKLKKLITDNGGQFAGAFESEVTDVLLLEKDQTNSAKYHAAVRYKKDCLSPEWIYESVEKGYAVAMSKHRVTAKKQSTPTKEDDSNFTINCSNMSEISHIDKPEIVLNETCSSVENEPGLSRRSTRSSKTTLTISKPTLILNRMSIPFVKNSGPFLDGCCIYIAGFTNEEKEKVVKILNIASAIRFDELNDKVTHIIVGEPNAKDMKYIKANRGGCLIVTVEWLEECMKQKCPAPENSFLYQMAGAESNDPGPEPPSPISKKMIDSMSNQFKKPNIPKFNLDIEPQTVKPAKVTENKKAEDDILEQYLQENNAVNMDSSDDNKTFLANVKFCIFGFEKEDEQQFEEDCRAWGADIVSENFTDTVDYLIVPIVIEADIPNEMLAKYVVNDLWMEDAISAKKMVDIEYYHKPVVISMENAPLNGINIVISTYTRNERTYLAEVSKAMGADVQEAYDRTKKPLLMCPLPEGEKYKASKKWKLPSVTCKWLLKCVESGKALPYDRFPVQPPLPPTNISHIIPTTQSQDESNISNGSKKRKSDELYDDDPNNFQSPVAVTNFAKKVLQSKDVHTPNNENNSDDDMSPATRRVKDFRTPIRELLYKSWKEREKVECSKQKKLEELLQTPGKELMSKTPPTPKLPEELKTPEVGCGFTKDSTPFSRKIHRSQIDALSKYYLPVEKSKPATPFSEIRKKFWKGMLGDNYNEDELHTQTVSQKLDELTQQQQKQQNQPTIDMTQPSSSTAAHVQQLRDIIKSRSVERRSYENEEDVDSIPFKMNTEMMGTESEMIGWRDPTEFNSLRRNQSMKYNGKPHFLISCSNLELKEKIIQQIKELKGEVCDLNLRYDSSCTHVLCEQPNRGEKIFSGIASGKWILSLNYIADSIAVGYFKDEEMYEWGNPNAMDLSHLEEQEQLIAKAAYRWRNKIATQPEKKSGIFTGFRVILHVVKVEQFQSLIKAGGGVVIDVKSPYRNSDAALSATHCFVEQKKLKLDRDDHKVFAEAGIRVLSVMYLNAYLVQENSPDNFAKYVINY